MIGRDETASAAVSDDWFVRSHAAWSRGDLLRAFRLSLIGARAGDCSCQQNLGYFYEQGIGVSCDLSKAEYWYGKACREGMSAAAAYNLALIHKKGGRVLAAESFFLRAVELGDVDAFLDLADLEIERGDPLRAAQLLRAVLADEAHATPSVVVVARNKLSTL